MKVTPFFPNFWLRQDTLRVQPQGNSFFTFYFQFFLKKLKSLGDTMPLGMYPGFASTLPIGSIKRARLERRILVRNKLAGASKNPSGSDKEMLCGCCNECFIAHIRVSSCSSSNSG